MPELPPLAEPSDLARRLKADENDPLISQAIARASSRFRGAVGYSVSPIMSDTITLDGSGGQTLVLPAIPVVSIASVTVSGTVVDPATYSVNKRWGILRRKDTWWPDDLGNIEITYSHGFDSIPGDIQDAVLEQAEHLYSVAVGIQQASTGGELVVFAKPGVSAIWSEAVDRYQIGRGDRP